jgi:bifunctional non-homologous end joining protein LigD
MLRTAFIVPCQPTLRKEPPAGDGWVHEVKFDGFRIQVHKDGKDVALFSKGGADWTRRYPSIAEGVRELRTRSLVLDAELAACASDGSQDFGALLSRNPAHLCIWVFDLLKLNGTDLRALSLSQRRKELDRVMADVRSDVIFYSEIFSDPNRLLAACAKYRLEGIVSKRADEPYRSGPCRSWIKVKCPEWREQNAWRHEFFARQKSAQSAW